VATRIAFGAFEEDFFWTNCSVFTSRVTKMPSTALEELTFFSKDFLSFLESLR